MGKLKEWNHKVAPMDAVAVVTPGVDRLESKEISKKGIYKLVEKV